MIKEFYKRKLLGAIFVVTLLLMVCVSIDYADNISNDTITNINSSTLQIDNSKFIMVNNSSVVAVDDKASRIIGKNSDVIHKVKPKYPVIGMYAKPSCGCRYSYTWHYREFINYCPNCHKYGTLAKNPKGVYEREYTCSRAKGGCDSDFCGVCGKEKYSWSRVYLRKC